MFDTGNTAFMFIATCLVMFMTPGLAIFYGGLVDRKNVVAIMFQSFVSLSVTTVLWFVVGYSLCFSGGEGAIIGNLDKAFMRGISPTDILSVSNKIPVFIFCLYQLMFAVITPILISGTFTNRVRFGPYILFLTAWLLLIYFPFVHMVWGGGLLQKNGILDFAGGIVVHTLAGMGALSAALFVGKRKNPTKGNHSMPLIAVGAGILWVGWYGFNSGSELKIDSITALAFFNTHIASAFGGITWMVIDWIKDKKPKLLGFILGALAGLVVITPAAGYVSPGSAVVFGLLASIVCYFAIIFKNKLGFDDTLDVWGLHGVGGVLGITLLGIFSSKAFNSAGVDGLIYGNVNFFVKQVLTVLLASVYSFTMTYGILFIINKVTPIRVTESEEELGLDMVLHNEQAYSDI